MTFVSSITALCDGPVRGDPDPGQRDDERPLAIRFRARDTFAADEYRVAGPCDDVTGLNPRACCQPIRARTCTTSAPILGIVRIVRPRAGSSADATLPPRDEPAPVASHPDAMQHRVRRHSHPKDPAPVLPTESGEVTGMPFTRSTTVHGRSRCLPAGPAGSTHVTTTPDFAEAPWRVTARAPVGQRQARPDWDLADAKDDRPAFISTSPERSPGCFHGDAIPATSPATVNRNVPARSSAHRERPE